MRFYTVLAVRPQYYDRGPINKVLSYLANGVAPHAPTTRWTYTVPSARKSFVANAYIELIRQTVAAPAGFAEDTILITPSGGSATFMLDISMYGNVADTFRNGTAGSGMALLAGDTIAGLTADGSTGGTMQHCVAVSMIEFDA